MRVEYYPASFSATWREKLTLNGKNRESPGRGDTRRPDAAACVDYGVTV